jgi:exodeoxyribonuclease V beta subunit
MSSFDPWALELSGTQLIEASAGTGKTYTLTTLYLRLLVEQDLLPSEILVVTYTHAATAELRERVRARIRDAIASAEDSGVAAATGDRALGADPTLASDPEQELRALALRARALGERRGKVDPLRRALQEFDEAAIYTIHGFCQRTLAENAFESGMAFDAELIEDSETLERTLAHDLWSRLLADEDPDFVEWLRYGAGRRWEFEPEALRRSILRELGADEEMPVLPARAIAKEDEGKDLDTLRAAAEVAWARWATVWQARREIVSELLLGENDLKRNSYKIETIASKWFPQLDLWATTISDSGDVASLNAVELPSWWKNLIPAGLLKGLKKNGQPIEDPFFEVCGEVAEAIFALDAARRARVLGLRIRFVAEAREESRKRRDQRHLLFFDDLLCKLRMALRPPEGDRLVDLLRTRYRFALIDEFQDTDPVQYEIFRRVWHDSNGANDANDSIDTTEQNEQRGLFLIGDPKQAIYSFRGADVFTYLAARKDARDGQHDLGVNYRSRPEAIAAVNALFEQPQQPFGLDEIEFKSVSSRPDAPDSLRIPDRSIAGLRVLMADRALAMKADVAPESAQKGFPLRFGRTTLMQAFARDVADLLDSGGEIDGRPIRPSDIAVLCRRKIELAQARRALEALGIPCVDRGDSDVFDSREAWELLSVLRAWLRSSDPALLRAALSTGAHGLDAPAIRKLSDESPELAIVAERFGEYARIWAQSGFGLAFESWRRKESVTERLLALQDGERRLTNWLHLAELMQRVEHDLAISRIGLVAWLDRAIAASEARGEFASEASLLRLERDDQAVSLVTLHRSKGLEYEIVYLPSLWEEPSARAPSAESAKDPGKARTPIRFYDEQTGKRTLDLGGADYAKHVERAREEGISEQFRLLYVGLTRAKQQCVVLWGALGTAYAKTPLAWLLHARSWEGEGKERASSSKELRGWSDDQWRSAWEEIGRCAGGSTIDAISIENASFEARERWSARRVEAASLEFEPTRRVLGRPVATTSFSALIRHARPGYGPDWANEALAGPIVTGQDRDDGLSPSREDFVEFDTASDLVPDLAAEMHEFPRGAEAGTLLHDVLERVDFSACDSVAIEAIARQAIRRSRFGAEHPDLIAQIVHVALSVARTPLRPSADRFCLADLPPGQQRPEIEFTLAAAGDRGQGGFSPAALSALLAGAEENSPLRRYADRVAQMNWRELNGYLRGFIDSVFHDGARYYLIDYKSNHLGTRQADYLPERLVQPMIDHDYILQYLIYSIALDRHLAQRLAGYDYDEHFGGAYYLFLRGLAESHEPGCGVFFDRPPREMIQAASALLGHGPGGIR